MCDPAPVIVVHGLWLNGLEFFLLRERLRGAGYAPAVFRYPSTHASLGEAAAALAGRLRSCAGPAHVVAHSLGGVVALETFSSGRDLPHGRVVLLGSPVRGSRAARGVAAHWFGPAMLGPLAMAELAREREAAWRLPREVGVIAGSRAVGMGRLFADLPSPNDGTVCVDETVLDGATDSAVIDVSHTGMLFSSAIANLVTRFLGHGRF